jgi:predicted RNase H-like HicB family nuclease
VPAREPKRHRAVLAGVRAEAAHNERVSARLDPIPVIATMVVFKESGLIESAIDSPALNKVGEPFNYRVVVEWSAEDDAFIARVPALHGGAAHGRTPESATREAVVAARGIPASMLSRAPSDDGRQIHAEVSIIPHQIRATGIARCDDTETEAFMHNHIELVMTEDRFFSIQG